MGGASYGHGMSTPSEPEVPAKPKYEDLGPNEKRWVDIKVWLIGAAVLAAVVACVVKVSAGPDTSNDLSYDAKRVCREFVEKRLKAPATAEFGGEATTHSGQSFTVAGHVDSQNSFGALIRSNYTCTVTASGEQWILDSITGLS